jgi:FkbM family methyltransferase
MKALIKSVLDAAFGASPLARRKLTNYLLREKLPVALSQLRSAGLPIDVVYDVGARHGEFTQSLRKTLPNARFILFEANPKCAPVLRARGFEHYISVLSSDVREVEFYDTDSTGDSYFKENTRRYDTVTPTRCTTQTLDALVTEHRLPKPHFIKLDTQGSELDILRGAPECLASSSLLYLECPTVRYNSGAPSLQQYLDFLDGAGFLPHELCEAHYSHGALVQLDVLFVRKEHLRRALPESQLPHFLA